MTEQSSDPGSYLTFEKLLRSVFWFYARTGRVCPILIFFEKWLITITDEPLVADETLNVLRALLHSIPVFWGAFVVKLYVDHCAPSSSMYSVAMSGLMKTNAKLAHV